MYLLTSLLSQPHSVYNHTLANYSKAIVQSSHAIMCSYSLHLAFYFRQFYLGFKVNSFVMIIKMEQNN